MRSAKYRLPVRKSFLMDETGASLVEYVLPGTLFAVVCALVLRAMGEDAEVAVADWHSPWS